MESEERPTKIRRVSHDVSTQVQGAADSTAPPTLDPLSEECAVQNGFDARELDTTAEVQVDTQRPESNGLDHTWDHQDPVEDDPVAETALPPPNETAPLAKFGIEDADAPPMSKNQQKKLRKKQEWESKREERKVFKKEKTVAKRERKRAAREHEAAAKGEDVDKPPEKSRAPPTRRAVTLPITILIDCDFDDLMRDNERISLAAQVTRSYSDNKNSLYRAHLAVCSFGGKLRERFDNILSHYKAWRGVRFLDGDFVDAAEMAKGWMTDEQSGGKFAGVFSGHADADEAAKSKLKAEGEVVYLSSESNETLTELKPYSTYIIGGLVDKNREKGICYKRATRRGIRTAKLPIVEFLEMQSRKVLATNHVNEIMLKWLECGDWGQAFLEVIPKRKGGKLKGSGVDGGGDEEAALGEDETLAADQDGNTEVATGDAFADCGDTAAHCEVDVAQTASSSHEASRS